MSLVHMAISLLSTHRPDHSTRKYFLVLLRREWPPLHNQAAKYLLALVSNVAPSKKVLFLDQCIENFTCSHGHFTSKHPPTRPTVLGNIFWCYYVENGPLYTIKLRNIYWHWFLM